MKSNKVRFAAFITILFVALSAESFAMAGRAGTVAKSSGQVVSQVVSSEASDSRLSVSDTKLWLSKSATFTVTLRNRADGENIKITPSKKKIVKISKDNWKGDSVTVTVKALKAGSTKLKITAGSETVTVPVVVKELSEKSADKIYADAWKACVEFDCYDKAGTEYIGSGFFIGEGKILTNYHVIEAASKMTISDYNGKVYTAESILAYDDTLDLAVVGVEKTNKQALIISGEKPVTGDTIYTIGSPYGYTGTFSKGLVSLASREMDKLEYIQITAATSQGSGGGPLLNTKGEVIGINTLTVKVAQNLNFALKIRYLSQLSYASPIDISDFYKGTSDKLYTTTILYTNEKHTFPGAGVLSVSNDSKGYGEVLSPQDIYKESRDSVVEITCCTPSGKEATGSGFFISEDVIVTNYHVIEGGVSLEVKDYNGNRFEVSTLEAWDKTIDIAILRVNGSKNHPWLEMDTRYIPATGETVYTLGSPYWYTNTFSEGIISMNTSFLDGLSYFQIEAPIFSGSSGGPLFNRYGKVIGINTAAYLSAQNVNFSLKISYYYELPKRDPMKIMDYYRSNYRKAA